MVEVSLDSSENVRGNYLSNDDIYDHMNLQLTTICIYYIALLLVVNVFIAIQLQYWALF